MIDLTGVPLPWPSRIQRIWVRCAAKAARDRAPAPTDWRGDEEFRATIAAHFGQPAELLTITAGARAAALMYARRRSHIVMEMPTFDGIPIVFKSVRFAAWDAMLSGHVPGTMLWFTSPARNPDGATLSAPERARIADLVKAGHRIVINGAYLWYHPAVPRIPGTDFVGTFSKLGVLGQRLGWVCSNDFHEECGATIAGASAPLVLQRTWRRFLRTGAAMEFIAACVARTAAASAAACAVLGRMAVQDGPNLVVPLAEGWSEHDAVRRLGGHGYAVSAGSHFRTRHPAIRANLVAATAAEATGFAELVTTIGLADSRACVALASNHQPWGEEDR